MTDNIENDVFNVEKLESLEVESNENNPFTTIDEVKARSGVRTATMERLAEAAAFGSLQKGRRDALWAVRGQAIERLPLFAAADTTMREIRPETSEPEVALRKMIEAMEVVEDYSSFGLSLGRHPISFLRDRLRQKGVLEAAALSELKDGSRVSVAGVVITLQRPKEVLFMTLEDETGHINLIIWPQLFARQRGEIMTDKLLLCRGRVQKEGVVIHVLAEQFTPLSELMQLDNDLPEDLLTNWQYIVQNFEARSRDFR